MSNHPELRWLKTVVVSVRETAHEMRQVGTRKTYQNMLGGGNSAGSRCGRVVSSEMASKPRGLRNLSGQSLAGARVLARWCPAYRRRDPGLLLLHGT